MGDFKGVKVSVEEVTADEMEIAREPEVGPEDVTALLQSHDKTLMDEELLLMDEQRKWFLEMETSEDAVKVTEMTAKNSEYYIDLVDKAVAGFERIVSNLEKSSTVVKCYQTLHATEKLLKKESINEASFIVVLFQKFPQPLQPSATSPLISQQPSTSRQEPPPAKRL